MEQKFSNQAMETFPVLPGDLINTHPEAEKFLEKMDSRNPADRKIVIEAIENLIEKYIAPLMTEYEQSDKSVDPFDLNAVIGTDIRGLVGGILDNKLKEGINRLEKPSDQFLKESLEYIDVHTENAGQRNSFFRSWAAVKASSTVGSLVNFLKKPFLGSHTVKSNGDFLSEKTRIQKILDQKLPNNVAAHLKGLIDVLNEI